MGFFENIRNSFSIDDDDYDDEDDEELAEEEVEEAPKRPVKRPRDEEPIESSSKITPMRNASQRKSTFGSGNTEVRVMKPASFDDVTEICDTLLSKKVVILNMEGLDLSIAQRIVDFMSGACYAIDGNLQKVSNYIFAITPKTIDISGDLQGLVDSANLSGIKTGF